jgi:ankyrin repeat protein
MQKVFEKLVIKLVKNDFANFKYLFENSLKDKKYDINFIGNIEKILDNLRYNDGQTKLSLIHVLFRCKSVDLLSFLKLFVMNNSNINQKSENGNTSLHEAIYCNNYDIIKMLIKKKADVNAQNNKLETPLHIASLLGFSEIIYLLLENKPNLKLRTSNNENALHYACYDCYDMMVLTMLVESGIDIHLKNKDGYTPFHILCYSCRDIDFINYLLENGVNINCQCKLGLTPLHLIFLSKHIDYEKKKEFADLLYMQNADVNIPDFMNDTALTLAEKCYVSQNIFI